VRRPQWPTEALTKITPFGIMNVNGVPKPVYRALQMLRDFTADAAPVAAASGSKGVVALPTSLGGRRGRGGGLRRGELHNHGPVNQLRRL